MDDDALKDLVDEKVITGGRATTAENVREVMKQFVDDKINNDKIGIQDGVCGLNSDGKIPDDNLGTATSFPVGAFLSNTGSWKIFERVTKSFNGNGSQTSFTFSHNIHSVPSNVQITPRHADSANRYYVSYDASTVTINFGSAPSAGTNNVSFDVLIME